MNSNPKFQVLKLGLQMKRGKMIKKNLSTQAWKSFRTTLDILRFKANIDVHMSLRVRLWGYKIGNLRKIFIEIVKKIYSKKTNFFILQKSLPHLKNILERKW
jgi:hypothetical protein